MIRYTLKCPDDHQFDSWFQSSEAFEKLCASGMITCTTCGSSDISKSVMSPRIRPSRSASKAMKPAETRPLVGPSSSEEALKRKMLAELQAKVEANSDYVGMEFAREARAIHTGEAPERPIYGEARIDEAKSLIEDGVPVAPLPFVPKRKTN